METYKIDELRALLAEARELATAIEWFISKNDPIAIKARAFLEKLAEDESI